MFAAQQPDRATDQPAGFSHSAGATRGKAIVVADEAYIEFCPQARWLAGWRNIRTWLFCAHCRSFCSGGASLRIYAGKRRSHQFLMKVIAPYPLSTPVADIAARR